VTGLYLTRTMHSKKSLAGSEIIVYLNIFNVSIVHFQLAFLKFSWNCLCDACVVCLATPEENSSESQIWPCTSNNWHRYHCSMHHRIWFKSRLLCMTFKMFGKYCLCELWTKWFLGCRLLLPMCTVSVSLSELHCAWVIRCSLCQTTFTSCFCLSLSECGCCQMFNVLKV